MSDLKSNFTSVAVNNSPSYEGDKKANTIHGVVSVLRLNDILSRMPENPQKIDDYLTKLEQSQKEARNLKKVLDFIGKF